MFGRRGKMVGNDTQQQDERFVPVGTVPTYLGNLIVAALEQEGIVSRMTESFDSLIRGQTVAVISTHARDSDQAARVIGAHWR